MNEWKFVEAIGGACWPPNQRLKPLFDIDASETLSICTLTNFSAKATSIRRVNIYILGLVISYCKQLRPTWSNIMYSRSNTNYSRTHASTEAKYSPSVQQTCSLSLSKYLALSLSCTCLGYHFCRYSALLCVQAYRSVLLKQSYCWSW